MMDRKEWSRFRPVFAFVGRFLGIYIAASLLFGWMVVSYRPDADPVTREVTYEVAALLRMFGLKAMAVEESGVDKIGLLLKNSRVVSVYEGCNGINVMIVWVSFLLAVGPWDRRMLIFSVLGFVGIHLLNLVRVALLFLVAAYWQKQFYFFHKYLFTAFLYVFVFAGWLWWLRIRNRQGDSEEHKAEAQ